MFVGSGEGFYVFYISMFDRAIFIFLKLPLQWDLKAIFWLYALRWTRGLT